MPPSERTQAQSEQEDEILERKPSHPVTTTLLIVSAVSLMVAIGITVTELERYVNRETRSDLSEYKVTAVQWHEQHYGQNQEQPEDAPTPRKKRAPKETPAEQPAGETPAPAEGKAPEGKAPEAPAPAPAPEGGSTGESTSGSSGG